jgi:hypothetical protein
MHICCIPHIPTPPLYAVYHTYLLTPPLSLDPTIPIKPTTGAEQLRYLPLPRRRHVVQILPPSRIRQRNQGIKPRLMCGFYWYLHHKGCGFYWFLHHLIFPSMPYTLLYPPIPIYPPIPSYTHIPFPQDPVRSRQGSHAHTYIRIPKVLTLFSFYPILLSLLLSFNTIILL